MRILAIDWGEKRVGLAMSDEGARFATPLDVIDAAVAERVIAELIKKEHVQRLLVGLPLNMDDSIGPSARKAVAFGRDLADSAGIAVVFVDERLSSFDAEQKLIDRKRGGEHITRKQKKSRLDAIVAAGLLQSFLDGQLPAIDIE